MKCTFLLKLVRDEMRALLAIKDVLLILLIRQLYAKENKREAIMLMKLAPDIIEFSKKRRVRYGTHQSPQTALRHDISNVLRAAQSKSHNCEP